MTNHNAANERMKRQYFAYLAEAQGHSEQSIDAVALAHLLFGCRILQPLGQGDADRQG